MSSTSKAFGLVFVKPNITNTCSSFALWKTDSYVSIDGQHNLREKVNTMHRHAEYMVEPDLPLIDVHAGVACLLSQSKVCKCVSYVRQLLTNTCQ